MDTTNLTQTIINASDTAQRIKGLHEAWSRLRRGDVGTESLSFALLDFVQTYQTRDDREAGLLGLILEVFRSRQHMPRPLGVSARLMRGAIAATMPEVRDACIEALEGHSLKEIFDELSAGFFDESIAPEDDFYFQRVLGNFKHEDLPNRAADLLQMATKG